MTVFPLGGYGDDDRHVNKVHGRISEMAGNAVGTEYRFGRRVTEYVVKRLCVNNTCNMVMRWSGC